MNAFSGFSIALNQTIRTTGTTIGAPADGQYPGVYCTVYDAGTANVSVIYTDTSNQKSNPFLVNTDGGFKFYGLASSYDLIFRTRSPHRMCNSASLAPQGQPAQREIRETRGRRAILERQDRPARKDCKASPDHRVFRGRRETRARRVLPAHKAFKARPDHRDRKAFRVHKATPEQPDRKG